MNAPALLHHALRCLDTLEALGGPPRWTLGGGVALALAWEHRTTLDLDVFLRDAQWLTALSPRLNPRTGRGASDYEEGSSSLRIAFPDGAIDFVMAPQLTSAEAAPVDLGGREVLVESVTEVMAKEIHYRSAEFRVRDVVDLAVALSARSIHERAGCTRPKPHGEPLPSEARESPDEAHSLCAAGGGKRRSPRIRDVSARST